MSLLPNKLQKIANIYKSTIERMTKNNDSSFFAINTSLHDLIERAYIAGRQAGLNEASIYFEETKGFEVPDVAVTLQYKHILTAFTEE